MEILGKILGSPARVKIMRLFLLSRGKSFRAKDIVQRSRVGSHLVRRELKLLSGVGFIKKRARVSPEWYLNPQFEFTDEFEDLLVHSGGLSKEAILENFKKVGQVKFIVISGIFIKNNDSRVDLLIVGDKMKKGKIEKGIRKIEAELGAELAYAIFDTKEFIYRLNMYDKLVRDILDYPHDVILQSKELSTSALKRA